MTIIRCRPSLSLDIRQKPWSRVGYNHDTRGVMATVPAPVWPLDVLEPIARLTALNRSRRAHGEMAASNLD